MILRWLSERGLLGRIVASLFGLAWNIVTYLVVPILVVEGIGPIEAVKRSGALLKKTWGEQIVGNFGDNQKTAQKLNLADITPLRNEEL